MNKPIIPGQAVGSLERGQVGFYPHDHFVYHWVGKEYTDHRAGDETFIDRALIDLMCQDLTGKKLENKMYVILGSNFNYQSGQYEANALYRHDWTVGIIKITAIRKGIENDRDNQYRCR